MQSSFNAVFWQKVLISNDFVTQQNAFIFIPPYPLGRVAETTALGLENLSHFSVISGSSGDSASRLDLASLEM